LLTQPIQQVGELNRVGNLDERDFLLDAELALCLVVVLATLQCFTTSLEVRKRAIVMFTLVLESEPQMAVVSIEFHSIAEIVYQPDGPRARQLFAR